MTHALHGRTVPTMRPVPLRRTGPSAGPLVATVAVLVALLTTAWLVALAYVAPDMTSLNTVQLTPALLPAHVPAIATTQLSSATAHHRKAHR